MHKNIGVIAGAGELPVIAVKEIISRGNKPVVISVADNPFLPEGAIPVGLGNVSQVIDTLHQHQVEEIIFIGKVDKKLLLGLDIDERARHILAGLSSWDDAALMLAITEELEREGLRVAKQTDYLGRLIPSSGILSQKRPDERQRQDIDYGVDLAKRVADLGIGQTIIVKDKMVIAVEAIEGTDEAILRGGRLASGGAVVIKASSTNHDLRFDVPTVGKETMSSMIKAGAGVLAVEAGRTFLVDGLIEEADKNGLVVAAV